MCTSTSNLLRVTDCVLYDETSRTSFFSEKVCQLSWVIFPPDTAWVSSCFNYHRFFPFLHKNFAENFHVLFFKEHEDGNEIGIVSFGIPYEIFFVRIDEVSIEHLNPFFSDVLGGLWFRIEDLGYDNFFRQLSQIPQVAERAKPSPKLERQR